MNVVGLASDVIGDAGFGHQIAFVGGVDEQAGVEFPAVFHADRGDGSTGFGPPAGEVESVAGEDGDRSGGEHLMDDGGGGGRFKPPEGVIRFFHPWVLGSLFPDPRLVVFVMFSDVAVELAG